MITVLKIITHTFFIFVMLVFVFGFALNDSYTGSDKESSLKMAVAVIGILIVVIWGGLISLLDFIKRKMEK